MTTPDDRIDSHSDESEWEYEYSTTEIEVRIAQPCTILTLIKHQTVYVTFDLPKPELSRRAAEARNRKSRAKRKPPAAEPAAAASKDTSGAPPASTPDEPVSPPASASPAADGAPATPTPATPANPTKSPTPAPAPAPAAPSAASPSRIQIADLHTRAPLLGYDGRLYAGRWGDTIGTELLLAAPSPAPPVPPLVADARFHLLATTRVKLLGHPATLVPRAQNPADAEEEEEEEERPLGRAARQKLAALGLGDVEEGDEEDREGAGSEERPVRLAVSKRAHAATKEQAAFLEEMIRIKWERGERDKIFIGKGRSYLWPDEEGAEPGATEGAPVQRAKRKRRASKKAGESTGAEAGEKAGAEAGEEAGEDAGENAGAETGEAGGETSAAAGEAAGASTDRSAAQLASPSHPADRPGNLVDMLHEEHTGSPSAGPAPSQVYDVPSGNDQAPPQQSSAGRDGPGS